MRRSCSLRFLVPDGLQQLQDLIELLDLEARKVLLQGLDLFFGLNIGIVISIRLRPVTE